MMGGIMLGGEVVRELIRAGQLKRGEEAAGFGEGFFVFGGGVGIGDDAGADTEVREVVFANGGADGDGELAFAIETEVAERAGVGAAGDGFEFVNDFHGANFWGAGDAAAGETSGEGGEMRDVGTEAAFDGGDEM